MWISDNSHVSWSLILLLVLLSISSKIRKAAPSSWAPQKPVGGIWLGNAGLRRSQALETLGEGRVKKKTLNNPSCTHFQDLPVCFIESETGGLVFLLLFVCIFLFVPSSELYSMWTVTLLVYVQGKMDSSVVGLDAVISWQFLPRRIRSGKAAFVLREMGHYCSITRWPHLGARPPQDFPGMGSASADDGLCYPLLIWVCLCVSDIWQM